MINYEMFLINIYVYIYNCKKKQFTNLFLHLFFNFNYLNTGWDIKHPIATITAQWVLMHVFGGTKLCIFFSFVVQMVGLLLSLSIFVLILFILKKRVLILVETHLNKLTNSVYQYTSVLFQNILQFFEYSSLN